MIDGETFVSYAIAGEVRPTEDPITFYVAGNTPDYHMASFNVSFYSESDSWEGTFSVEIHAPNFELSNPVILDENLDGIFDPGESATIEVDLLNTGSAAFMWYPGATISTNSPYINILSYGAENTFYGIFANDSYLGSFLIEADEDTPPGTVADFVIDWGASEISQGWCDDYLCPESAILNFSITIGLETDSNLMTPQNVMALAQDDGSIYIQWDEAMEFDCAADAPYQDECYAYVIEIDSYCCNYSWDGICEGEYQDCINGSSYNSDNLDYLTSESDREIAEFDQGIFDEINNREIMGYYVFRDAQFIDFVVGNFYYDLDVISGIEYCYSVSAVYDSAQSDLSYESCAESIADFVIGDVNFDGSLDVTDIILVINMIFESEEPNYLVADINDDGIINVLDIILMANAILNQ